MAEKTEFTATTVVQRDCWGERVLTIIIPEEHKGELDSRGGDICEVAIKPIEKDKTDVAKNL